MNEENKKKKWLVAVVIIAKTVIIAAAVLLVAFLCAFFIPHTVKQSNKIGDYDKYLEKVCYAAEFMPSLDEIGDYENVNFGYKEYSHGWMFCSEGLSLFAEYSDEDYNAEKEKTVYKYEYLTEPYKPTENSDYIFPVAELEYKGYEFGIVPKKEYLYGSDTEYRYSCKSFMLVGNNDAERKIVYLYFYDSDLDLLAQADATEEECRQSMIELIKDSCCWFD